MQKSCIFTGVVVTKSQITHLKSVHFIECKVYPSFLKNTIYLEDPKIKYNLSP